MLHPGDYNRLLVSHRAEASNRWQTDKKKGTAQGAVRAVSGGFLSDYQ